MILSTRELGHDCTAYQEWRPNSYPEVPGSGGYVWVVRFGWDAVSSYEAPIHHVSEAVIFPPRDGLGAYTVELYQQGAPLFGVVGLEAALDFAASSLRSADAIRRLGGGK